MTLGFKLVIKEIPAICGLIEHRDLTTHNAWQIFWILTSNLTRINFSTLLISVFIICVITIGVRYKKKVPVPWYLILGIAAIVVGLTVPKRNSIFKSENFGGKLSQDSNLQAFFRDVIDSHPYHTGLFKFKQPLQLDFFLNCFFLAVMTLIESSVTIRLSTHLNKTIYNQSTELYCIAISNFISGLLGLLPMGFPIGRNVLSIACGAASITYTLFCMIAMICFTMIFLNTFMTLPVIFKSIISIAVGVSLLDIKNISQYTKSRMFYGILTFLFVLISFFVEVSLCVFYFYLIYFSIYLTKGGNFSYTVGKIEDLNTRIEFFKVHNPEYPGSLKEYLIRAHIDRSKDDIVENFEEHTVIYQFRGLFNFFYTQDHMANIRLLNKKIVILDFKYVFEHDMEQLTGYLFLINRIIRNDYFYIFITGIPHSFATKDPIMARTWITPLMNDENDRVIFAN